MSGRTATAYLAHMPSADSSGKYFTAVYLSIFAIQFDTSLAIFIGALPTSAELTAAPSMDNFSYTFCGPPDDCAPIGRESMIPLFHKQLKKAISSHQEFRTCGPIDTMIPFRVEGRERRLRNHHGCRPSASSSSAS
jgi:hypothetical protein